MKTLKSFANESLLDNDDEICSLCQTILTEFFETNKEITEDTDDVKRKDILEKMMTFASDFIDENSVYESDRRRRVKNFLSKHGNNAKRAIGGFLHSMIHDPHVR